MDKNRVLKETKEKLKKEFVGLDSIIDRIIDLVTPWYLTPEVLEKPTVISLWGLTGTGKTSMVKKLIQYLGLSGKSLFYDCGEMSDSSGKFSSGLKSMFSGSSQIMENDTRYTKEELDEVGIEPRSLGSAVEKSCPLDYTIVLDEFQFLNTKNPMTSEECMKPESKAVWTLLDSGMIDVIDGGFRMESLVGYLEEMEIFSDAYPGLEISEGRFKPEQNSLLKQQLAYYRWTDSEYEKKKELGFKVLFDEDFSYLVKRLNSVKKGLGLAVGDKLRTFKTLAGFLDYIKKYIEIIEKPILLNFSRSLIFVLGNLDEAFKLSSDDLDPDIDADVYHEITSKVSCMDIKYALGQRFRDEQVGRLGNNIIVYPSLRRCDFEKILENEVENKVTRYFKSNGVKVIVTDKLKRLLYSEGCFPIQGCRPLFSTINAILSPMFSDVSLSGRKETMVFSVEEDNFNRKTVTLLVDTEGGERIGSREIQLTLGELRSPERCKKLGLQAVHEASHSVLYYILTGKTPKAIIASNVFGDGGYMLEEIDKTFSVDNIRDLKTDVIVSLAGYFGERQFFDEDMCSLGAGSDLKAVWDRLSKAYYQQGLYIPLPISEAQVSTENSGIPYGITKPIEDELLKFFNTLAGETAKLIEKETVFIGRVAEYLIENRSMSTEKFLEYAEKYRVVKKDLPGENYYCETIKKVLNEKSI